MTFRRLLYHVHRTTAIVAGLWLAAIGLSGALLVFAPEIDAWSTPELFQVEPGKEYQSLDVIVESVAYAFPEEPVFRIRLPEQPHDSLQLWLTSTSGRRVYVDPHDGKILGSRLPEQTVLGIVRRVHVELLLGRVGRTLVGVCGFAMLLLVASGLKMWWPGWRRLRSGFRLRANAWHARLYFWHRALGVAASILLTLSALSGIALVFDAPAEQFVALVTGRAHAAKAPANPDYDDALPISFDTALATARDIFPEAQATFIWLPTPSRGITAVRMRQSSEVHPNGKSYVYLDGATQRVLGIADAAKSDDVSAVTNLFYPIHTGEIGGTGMRGLMLFGGLAPLALLATGIGSWWLRKSRSRKKTSPN